MNKSHFRYMLFPLVLVSLSSCATSYNPSRSSAICERYYHTYGVEVSQEEWEKRGKNGEVIAVLDNGITERKSYANGVLQGPVSYTFPHTALIEVAEEYQQGKLVKKTLHYPSGTPHHQEEWLGGGEHIVNTWYEDGIPALVERYEYDALIEGYYFQKNYEQDSLIVDGDGQRTLRDKYGQLVAIDQFRNGNRVLCTTLYPSGVPKSVTPYVNSQIDGEKKTYFPGGEPHHVEEWVAGKQEGITLVFENGAIAAQIPYKEGHKHGIEKRYGGDEQRLVEEITWEEGSRQGPTHIFVENNVKTEWYYEDQLVSKAAYEAQMRPIVH